MLCKKSQKSIQGKTEEQNYILSKELQETRAISRINKTTSKLLRSKMALTVGACHDVSELSYDNDLYI